MITYKLHQQRSKSCPAHQIKAKTKNQMLNLGNLSVNNIDIIVFGAYVLMFLVNRNAFASILLMSVYVAVHATPYRSFYCYIACAMVYFISSVINIRILIEIRQAFTCFGVIYLLSAVDNFVSYHFAVDTEMDKLLKPAVIITNAYVLACLFGDWRRNNATGLYHACAWLWGWYKMHPLRFYRPKEKI